MASRDRLDGSEKKNVLFELYTIPGRIILWLGYMFPGKNYSKVRMSARHARSPIMTFVYSTVFYYFLFSSWLPGSVNDIQPESNNSQSSPQSSTVNATPAAVDPAASSDRDSSSDAVAFWNSLIKREPAESLNDIQPESNNSQSSPQASTVNSTPAAADPAASSDRDSSSDAVAFWNSLIKREPAESLNANQPQSNSSQSSPQASTVNSTPAAADQVAP